MKLLIADFRLQLGVLIACTLAARLAAQTRDPASVGKQVDIAEIDRTLKVIDVDRTSGGEGERQSAAYLEKKLADYGIKHIRYDIKAYLSWPKHAELSMSGATPMSFHAVTPAFSASTGPAGITGELFFLPERVERDDDVVRSRLSADVRGKIVVAPGMISPESVLRAQQGGAIGLIHVNENDILHEMIATTIWGTPGAGDIDRIPRIPVLSISQADGRALRQAATPRVKLVTQLEQRWTTIPLVIADVPGATDDFVLVATHLDAWYHGMTDTAGTVASILDMARVLQQHRGELARGVRFAWWPGHSFGRYPGSTWYVDHFWADLDRHGVAYTNLDGSGRRGSRTDAVTAGGWPGIGEFSHEFARRLTGKAAGSRGGDRPFRPGRDSDSSFQGIGMPEFSIGVPGPGRGHPDVEDTGRIKYWHAADDTYDKLDLNALRLDTEYRLAELYAIATMPVVPLKVAPIAHAYVRALDDLSQAAGSSFDLSSTRQLAAALQAAAATFDAQPAPTSKDAIDARNRLLVRITHGLNSRLYTGAGRFLHDPAAAMPILPQLARAAELSKLPPASDEFGFLEAELIRGRNAVEATLRDATAAIVP